MLLEIYVLPVLLVLNIFTGSFVLFHSNVVHIHTLLMLSICFVLNNNQFNNNKNIHLPGLKWS